MEIISQFVKFPTEAGFSHAGSHFFWEFFCVKKFVLTRRCAQPPVCIRTHKNDHVWWIMETQKDPACTLTDRRINVCIVNVNSRVLNICTWNSTHWQQDSKLSVQQRFELIWKDWGKGSYQYNITRLELKFLQCVCPPKLTPQCWMLASIDLGWQRQWTDERLLSKSKSK